MNTAVESGIFIRRMTCSDDGLAAHVDLERLWRRSGQVAVVILQESGAIVPTRVEQCPLSIEQLIDPDMHPSEARAIIMDTIPEAHRVYW